MPQSQGVVRREAVFGDVKAATAFAQDIYRVAAGGGGGFPINFAPGVQNGAEGPFPHYLFEELTQRHGGQMHYSTRGREWNTYHYQPTIYAQDREYLHARDPTTTFLNTRLPMDAWWRLPLTGESEIDSYFRLIRNLGFNQSAEASHIFGNRDGGGLLYIRATGRYDQAIKPGNRPVGFDYILAEDIIPESIVPDRSGDPIFRQHGIHSLQIKSKDPTKGPVTIHGSRLIRFRPDNTTKDLIGQALIDPCYDDVWNYRDIVFSGTRQQFQGNPIVVGVDRELAMKLGQPVKVKPETLDAIAQEMNNFETAGQQSFSPVEGLTISRLGAPEMDDATPTTRTLVSRIHNGVKGIYPVNMITASSRGSEQVTDQDRIDYASNVVIHNERFNIPILAQIIEVGKVMGLVPRRAEMPLDLEWPELRISNAKERAYILNTEAMALVNAGKAGWEPAEDRVMRKFRPRPDGILAKPPEAEETRTFEEEQADLDRQHETQENDKDRKSEEKKAKQKPKPTKK